MATGMSGVGDGLSWEVRSTLASALLVAMSGAGCLDGFQPGEHSTGEEPVSGPPDQAKYWFVWVQGQERHDPDPGFSCDYDFNHSIDENRTIVRYEEREYDIDPDSVGFLIAFDHFESPTGCPITYGVRVAVPVVREAMGRFGPLELRVHENGTVIANGESVIGPGETATFAYEDAYAEASQSVLVNGEITIRHYGAWPRSGLRPTSF
jgi:hypothetical protein